MSDIKISVMNGKNPAFSVSMTDEQVKYCTNAANEHDNLVEQNAALRAALVELMDKAGECDSWESFPIQYLDDAQAALEQSK
tara:strand:- start:1201 stop:1446 length:246 start_codon:yes stop_codon:yes gene_type:complete